MEFPDPGCKEAFRCGQEFYLSGAPSKTIPEALEFCETRQEKLYFLLGIIMEIMDLPETILT
jgi:hypothetical protein